MQRNLWSSWTEYLNVSSTDTLEEFSEKLVPQVESDVMMLKLKDMNLFGYSSEYDDFYLVICQFCGKSIKPQSLSLHVELRHKKLNMHKLSLPGSMQQASLLTFLPSKCSSENSTTNETNLTTVKNSAIYAVSGTKEKLKIMSNKKHTIYVQPYPRPGSLSTCHKRISEKFTSYSPSSDMVRAALSRNIASEKHYYETLKTDAHIKTLSSESSSSACDSPTSMTVFLHHSFVMPNIKLCDIEDKHSNHIQCLNSKTLPKKNCLTKATILSQVLPEKRSKQSIRSPRQGSQVHQGKEVADWSSLQNSTNLNLNGVSYPSWNQHSSSFRPLSHAVSMTKNEQMNSHSFNCSDLTKRFGDLESQVLIHNAAMGT